jgi:Tfp pilus assembly protein PilV
MKGQSLVESVLALGVISVVLTSIAVLLVSSLSNAGQGKDQSLATQHAQQGVELLRKIRNDNYRAFRSYSGTYCLGEGVSALGTPSTCNNPNIDTFIRSAEIEQSPGCGANISKITVKVAWTDGKCSTGTYCHVSELISCLSTVSPIKAP